jgi:hypothetical protein
MTSMTSTSRRRRRLRPSARCMLRPVTIDVELQMHGLEVVNVAWLLLPRDGCVGECLLARGRLPPAARATLEIRKASRAWL